MPGGGPRDFPLWPHGAPGVCAMRSPFPLWLPGFVSITLGALLGTHGWPLVGAGLVGLGVVVSGTLFFCIACRGELCLVAQELRDARGFPILSEYVLVRTRLVRGALGELRAAEPELVAAFFRRHPRVASLTVRCYRVYPLGDIGEYGLEASRHRRSRSAS